MFLITNFRKSSRAAHRDPKWLHFLSACMCSTEKKEDTSVIIVRFSQTFSSMFDYRGNIKILSFSLIPKILVA